MTLVFVISEDLVHSSPQIDSPPDNSLYPYWDLFISTEYTINYVIAKISQSSSSTTIRLAS